MPHFSSVPSATTASTDTPVVETTPKPWLLVGLGNPGKKYQGTRHNVGFEMVDTVAEAEGISMSTVCFKALFGKGGYDKLGFDEEDIRRYIRGCIGNVPVMLAKPQTFMNLSGESVGSIVSYYKIPLKQVLVIYDDLDLPFAKLRLLPKGGHGGHNGMRSVIDRFKGSHDFPRLRIGIGRPPGKMDPINFVIRPFNRQEREEDGLEAIRILLLEGFNKSATFVNSAKTLEQLVNPQHCFKKRCSHKSFKPRGQNLWSEDHSCPSNFKEAKQLKSALKKKRSVGISVRNLVGGKGSEKGN
ncbi:hypothetical protein HHK36_029817 [Tetracentron sinense]|uniref:peptidyl-tRNA hydrolase n=1 Tax=Tetracentron sinense TaxID=13715 RepID=A0A835D243_TETSI|nr:hypothetical protein HHK36_029817 [Tetracentron sinense]